MGEQVEARFTYGRRAVHTGPIEARDAGHHGPNAAENCETTPSTLRNIPTIGNLQGDYGGPAHLSSSLASYSLGLSRTSYWYTDNGISLAFASANQLSDAFT